MNLAGPLSVASLVVAAAVLARGAPAAEAEATVEGPVAGDAGALVYTVTSPYQKGPNAVEVLLPETLDPKRRCPVLYILPVEVGTRRRWGSGILEAKRTNVHNRYGLICVAPAFDTVPWYADHPTDPKVRQESYLLKVVVPLIERRHPALAEPGGRLLVGFSKSGWGAWSLLLRHPDVFGRAAAWDAPLMEASPTKYGMGEVFGTQATFDRYRISALVRQRADLLKRDPARLVLTGYGNFRGPTAEMHERLLALAVPHHYANQTARKHDWHSGWFAEAVRLLVEPPATRPDAAPAP